MRYVKTMNAKSGDILARTIYGLHGHILIKANTVLTPFLIQRLIMLGYPSIYLFDPGESDSALKLALDEHTRIQAASHLRNIDLDKCTYIANEVVRQVLEMKDLAAEVNRISGYDLCTWTHSIDVCTYAVMCGVAMQYNDKELKELSQAALLHDIGKIMVNLDILNKPAKLTDDEFALMKNHTDYGWNILRQNTFLSAPVCASVYEHHENEDGSGYPRGITGDKIYRYAKIIHAVDVYEACTAIRPYKKAMNPADAMENLMSGYGSIFDTHVIDIFRSIAVLYPVGRQVLLSDGRIGAVAENRREVLQRPVVKLSDGTWIDLCKTLDITILKLID